MWEPLRHSDPREPIATKYDPFFKASTCQILPRTTKQDHERSRASCLSSQAADGNLTMARSNTQIPPTQTLKVETRPLHAHAASSFFLPLKTQDGEKNNSEMKPSQWTQTLARVHKTWAPAIHRVPVLTHSLPSSIGKGHLCGTLRPKAWRQRWRKHTHSKKTKHERTIQARKKGVKWARHEGVLLQGQSSELRQGNLGFKANLGYSEFQGSLGYKVKACQR